MVIGCLSDVSVICRVVNLPRTSQKIWGGFWYEVYRQGNNFESIPTVKMETSGSELWSSVVIAEFW